MKLMKRVTALFLCFLLSSGSVSASAQTSVPCNNVAAEEESTAPAETESAAQPGTEAPVTTDAVVNCELCNTDNCRSDHANWCDICKADDCGKTHVNCGTCGLTDAHTDDCGTQYVDEGNESTGDGDELAGEGDEPSGEGDGLAGEELKTLLANVIGGNEMDEWQENQTVNENMMQWAILTGGNRNIYLADDEQLYFIYSGTARATLNKETSQIVDNCYNMPVAQLDMETGEIKALTNKPGALDGGASIKTQEEYLEAADSVLLDAVMSFDSASAFEHTFENIEVEERNAFISRLSEENRRAAYDYLLELSWKNLSSYTNAAPFVSAPAASRASDMTPSGLARGAASSVEENGLILSKTSQYNASTNSAEICLEAYVTGTVTTETVEEDIPCDILLVLDFSQSMEAAFGTGGGNRRDALQAAVNNFIHTVYEKYQSGGVDHRISLIEYNSDVNLRNEWTVVDSQANVDDLLITDTEKDDWSDTNGTQTHAALADAYTLLDALPETEEVRQKVLILFTDGAVSGGNAANVINNARQIKALDGGCSVYTVAIMDGLDPSLDLEIEEGSTFIKGDDDSSATSLEQMHWKKYMNATFHGTSSNYPAMTAAASEGSYNFGNGSDDYYIITVSNTAINPAVDTNGNGRFDSGEPGYYLVADSPENLNNIFQSIASNIQSGSANIQLDSSTVVKDIVSDYFDSPAEVTVMTYDCLSYDEETGLAEWSTTGSALSSAVTIDSASKTVNVTGFDFSENFVSEEGRAENDDSQAGTFHGKKLVITFNAPVRNGFLGGNSVPTNGSATGVYSDGRLVEAFNQPIVDVPVPDLTVNAPDYSVYLLGGKTAEQLKAGITVTTDNGQTIGLDPSASNYGLAPWQNDYVSIENSVAACTGLTADTAYTASVSITPNSSGTYTAKSGTGTGSIYVYKPVVTYRDSTIDHGTAADYEALNFAGIVWMHGAAAAPSSMGAAPELTYIYSPAEAAFAAETSVQASVNIGPTDVTRYVSFYRDACTYDSCSNKTQTSVDAADANRVNFVVHINRYSLTITKTGTEASDENQSYLFHVSGPNNFEMDVVIYGNGSVTIKDLPVGEYTVTENGDWSWRYDTETGTITQTITYNEAANYKTANFFNFENTRTDRSWLSGDSYCENWWGGENGTKLVKREEYE